MPKTTIPITAGADRHLSHVSLEKLVQFSDEELCRKAQRGCAASRDLLWKRHVAFIRIVVYKQNKHLQLPPHEIRDALQELYFAFHEAVQQYAPQSHCKGNPASFKTFLSIVVVHSFSEYCTRWRKYRRRFAFDLNGKASQHFTVEAEDISFSTLYPTDRNGCLCADLGSDLLNQISSDKLAEGLRKLKPKERYLLEVWLQCGRDKEVAEILGISASAARLRRERLFRRIKLRIVSK